ncbi:MAG: hypothetical protein U1E70_29980, partial [Acetobacteraceae bacterium]
MCLGSAVSSGASVFVLGCTLALAVSPSHAADAPSFRLFDDALTIRPYVLNQFDLGGAWGASQRNPTGGFNVRRIRYGVQADLPDDLSVRFIWDFGDSGFGWP